MGLLILMIYKIFSEILKLYFYNNIFKLEFVIYLFLHGDWGLGIGDWGLGIGDWGLGKIGRAHV